MVAAMAVGTGGLGRDQRFSGLDRKKGKGGISHIQQLKAAQPFRQGKYTKKSIYMLKQETRNLNLNSYRPAT